MIRNVFGALLGVAAAVSVGAAEVVWTGSGGDGLWSTPGNWQGGAVPGADDTAVVASSDALTIDECVLAPLATLRKTGDQVLAWTKKPEPMPQFICDKPQKGGKFYVDEEGLFYRAPMMWILLR